MCQLLEQNMKPSDLKPSKTMILMEYLDNPQAGDETGSSEDSDFVFCSTAEEMAELREEIKNLLTSDPEWREEWKSLKMMRRVGKGLIVDDEEVDVRISDEDLRVFIYGQLNDEQMQEIKGKLIASRSNRARLAVLLDAFDAEKASSVKLPACLADKAAEIANISSKPNNSDENSE